VVIYRLLIQDRRGEIREDSRLLGLVAVRSLALCRDDS
jgi:hypothetical protein